MSEFSQGIDKNFYTIFQWVLYSGPSWVDKNYFQKPAGIAGFMILHRHCQVLPSEVSDANLHFERSQTKVFSIKLSTISTSGMQKSLKDLYILLVKYSVTSIGQKFRRFRSFTENRYIERFQASGDNLKTESGVLGLCES